MTFNKGKEDFTIRNDANGKMMIGARAVRAYMDEIPDHVAADIKDLNRADGGELSALAQLTVMLGDEAMTPERKRKILKEVLQRQKEEKRKLKKQIAGADERLRYIERSQRAYADMVDWLDKPLILEKAIETPVPSLKAHLSRVPEFL